MFGGGLSTHQEVLVPFKFFQDACQNHYVTCEVPSPMVFLDKNYWTEEKACLSGTRKFIKRPSLRGYARYL